MDSHGRRRSGVTKAARENKVKAYLWWSIVRYGDMLIATKRATQLCLTNNVQLLWCITSNRLNFHILNYSESLVGSILNVDLQSFIYHHTSMNTNPFAEAQLKHRITSVLRQLSESEKKKERRSREYLQVKMLSLKLKSYRNLVL